MVDNYSFWPFRSAQNTNNTLVPNVVSCMFPFSFETNTHLYASLIVIISYFFSVPVVRKNSGHRVSDLSTNGSLRSYVYCMLFFILSGHTVTDDLLFTVVAVIICFLRSRGLQKQWPPYAHYLYSE